MKANSQGKPLRILLVDDEEIVHQTIAPYLRDCGHLTDDAWDGQAALAMIAREDYELVLVDVRMPGVDGLSVLSRVHDSHPDLPVVIITGHGDMEMVVQALRLGAADFLSKPIRLLELDAVIEKTTRVRSLLQHQRRLQETISGIQTTAYNLAGTTNLVGVSRAMNELRSQIRLAVDARCETILVTGETGTGKEVVAREIHFTGKKAGSPFIAVSCPALPETLVESELFGHVKGSFTGASADKAGCFELANGGTLFLDEIADLSEGAQAKILRALDTRKVRRVGGSKEIDVDVGVVAATNTPLELLVETKKFRCDLFFRLNVFTIKIPPLRERRDDILPLADHFLGAYLPGRGLEVEGFSPEAKELLLGYDYPGNARELRNLVERAAILCRLGAIRAEHLNLPHAPGPRPMPRPEADGDVVEREEIRAALEKTRWNRRLAAQELGISYPALRYKIRKYGLR